MDKVDIINISKKIGTYDISIRPFIDCCTIFTPKSPKTAPHLDECLKFENEFDYEPLIQEALNNLEVKFISSEEDNNDDLL